MNDNPLNIQDNRFVHSNHYNRISLLVSGGSLVTANYGPSHYKYHLLSATMLPNKISRATLFMITP